MRTDLAYINDTIECELTAQERGKSRPAVEVKPVQLHGFKMPEKLTRAAEEAGALSVRRAAIKTYRERAAELRVKLMAAGIEPIAVLPHKAWISLCNKARLFRMAPGAHNKIGLDSSVINRLRGEGPIWAFSFALAIIVAPLFATLAAWLTIALGVWSYDANPIQFIAVAAIFIGSIIAGRAAYDLLHGALTPGRYRRNVENYLAGKTWADVLLDMAPGRSLDLNGIALTVELPSPPIKIAEIIMRAHKLPFSLHVAAEADAITVPGGMRSIFDIGLAQIVQREAEEAARLRADPIIYVIDVTDRWQARDNDPVAILAQYGDFPIEKEVVDKLIKSRKII